MNRINMRQTKAQVLSGALLFVVFTALWLGISSFLSLRTKSKEIKVEHPIVLNPLVSPNSIVSNSETKKTDINRNLAPQFDLPSPPTSRIEIDKEGDQAAGDSIQRNLKFRLVAESDAQKVFRELQNQQSKDPQIIELESELSAFLAKEKWLRDYDKAYVKAYTETFIENAKKEGWKVAFNEKLEIVEFARIRRPEPIRFPQSLSTPPEMEKPSSREYLLITENVLSPKPRPPFFSGSECLISQSNERPQN